MKNLIRNFRRLFRAAFLDPRPEVDLENVPRYLNQQREKALFATIFFFILLQVYQTFFRPYQIPTMFWGNLIMLAVAIVGLLIVTRGRLRGGLVFLVYGEMIALGTFHMLMIQHGIDDPSFRPPIIGSFFYSLFTLYLLITVGFYLDRRHILVVGAAGLLFLFANVLMVRERRFFDLVLTPFAFIAAATILLTFFYDLFTTVQNRLIALTGGLADIVEKRTAELRLSERLLEEAQRVASVGNFAVHLPERNVSCSPELRRILGLSASDDTVTLERIRARIHPDDRASWAANIERTLKEGVPFEHEHRLIGPDGVERVVRARAEAIRNDEGRIVRLVGIKQDITERKRIETALRESRAQAVQANAAKSVFLTTMSHEMRSPLNAILGFADLMLQPENAALDADHVRHFASIIRRSGADLLALIDDLLDITRIEIGSLKLMAEPTDVRDLVRHIDLSLGPEAAKKGLEWRLTVAPEVAKFLVLDGRRLRQVLVNLLNNAIKYSDKGSVRCRIEATPPDNGRQQLKLTVADTGRGMPPGVLNRIFEPFYQAEPGKGVGVGIGLPITLQLVELMGGTLRVESKVGEGSVFTVDFPSLATATPEEIEAEDAAQPVLAGTCLIVDDSPENRLLLHEALDRTGLRIFDAKNGEEALEIATRVRPDMVILDLRLPGIDGCEVLRRLRTDEAMRDIKAIASTATLLHEDERRIREAGFDAVLPKPISIDTLHDLMGRLAGKKKR